MNYRIEQQYKILIDDTKTAAAKRAVPLEGLTDAEVAAWEERQRAQRKQYRDYLRSKGRV